MRLAHAFEADTGSETRALARVLTPAAKYWICKRGPPLAAEALEVLGGNGYVEENPLPRLYREMPVNSIWEGSGNVIALDVVRALSREPAVRDALHAHLHASTGIDARYDEAIRVLDQALSAALDDASAARRLAQLVTLTAQAALLIRHAPPYVADAFCASRLGEARYAGAAFGTLPKGADTVAIVARARGA
jgi:putative acyl-CoA dehydrogenase